MTESGIFSDRIRCGGAALVGLFILIATIAASDRTDAAIAKPETPFGRVDTRGMDPR